MILTHKYELQLNRQLSAQNCYTRSSEMPRKVINRSPQEKAKVDAGLTRNNEGISMKHNPITQLLIFPEEAFNRNIEEDSMKKQKAVNPINIKQVLHGLPPKKIQKHPSGKYICTLCAASSDFSKGYTSINHFAAMIEEFAGVDVLKFHSSPVACSFCYKQLRMVQNFKKQIVYTDRLISTTNIMDEFKVNDELFSGALRSTLDCSNKPNEERTENADLQTNEKENMNASKFDDELFSGVLRSMLDCSNKPNQERTENADLQTNEKENVNASKFDDDEWFRWDVKEDEFEIKIVEVESILNKNLSTEKEKRNKFLCTGCGKQYTRLLKLEQHKCVHGDGKYLCEVCGSTFFYEINLIRHLRTHSGEKPFACIHCNRKFSLQWNLYQHLRIHTNSRPYKCKMCPNAYRHNVSLKTHVAKSHSALECAYSATKSDTAASGNNS